MGAGSWGTTFAQVLCDAGTPAVLFARSPELAKVISSTRENPAYLPGIALTDALRATADPAEALDGADLVVLAVPAQSLRENLARWAPLLPPGALLVSLMKGIELGTCSRMSEVISQVAGAPAERIAVVSGPNLSREIARREHAATVVACTDNAAAERLQRACHTGYFRPDPAPRDRAPRPRGDGRRVHRQRRRRAAAAGVSHRLLPPVHKPGRDRLRAGRRGEERHRAGGRDGGRHGARRQHAGDADHPRAGRDGPGGSGALRRRR